MSLITNEIHIMNGFEKTVLVFAADRRLSKPDGSFDSNQPKLFRIPYLDGGISYFGLAEIIWSDGRRLHFSNWLPAFINKQGAIRDLGEFAFRLRDELEQCRSQLNTPEDVFWVSHLS